MTPDPGQWHRLHPLSPLVRSGRAAVGVLAIVGISASGQFGPGGSHLYDWAVAVESFKLNDLNTSLAKLGLAVESHRRHLEVVVVRKV